MDSDNILQGSIQSASYNILFQISFRIITFVLNGFILHYISQDVLGVMNVRLMLLFMTIMFVSREAFRRSCMSNTRKHNWPQVVNLLWLTVPNMIIWSSVFCYIWIYWLETPSKNIIPDYNFAVVIIGISCVIESFVEPIYVFSQAFLYVRWRLLVDCTMLTIRIVLLVATVIYHPQAVIKSFVYGQLIVSTLIVILYSIYFHQEFQSKRKKMKNKEIHPNDPQLGLPFDSLWDFFPRRITGQAFIGYDLATLTWSFFKQGILKQVLTEGERYIMTVFSVLTFAEQGVYDVVNNLGSMAARFLLLPIEESGYFYFAQMVRRDVPLENQTRGDVEKVTKVFHTLLRGLSLLGSIIMVFGFSYSHLILRIYGGHTLTDGGGPLLLRVHCACVYLLAVNGITEAYVFASMSQEELNTYNHFMVILSAFFLFFSWLFSHFLGSVGFILANCANMAFRIAHSVWFIHRQYRTFPSSPLYGLWQSKTEVAALLISFLVTATSEMVIYPWSATLHVFIGAVCGSAVLGAIFYTEPDLLNMIIIAVKKRLGKSD